MFPNILKDLTFWAVFRGNGFLALPNFKYQFLKNEDQYQNFGRLLFGTHLLVYFSKLNFTETPKTLIGGIKSETSSEKLAFLSLIEQMLILALPVIRSSSNLAGWKISCIALIYLATIWIEQIPKKKLSQFEFWILWKLATFCSKSCSVDPIHRKFWP